MLLSQPISTHCTIATKVQESVCLPAMGKTKAKAGQGDFKSIIFCTNKQAKIMLMEQQFVFLSVPGRQLNPSSIFMREKVAIWATKNKKERLFFAVFRTGDAGI